MLCTGGGGDKCKECVLCSVQGEGGGGETSVKSACCALYRGRGGQV